MTTGWRIKTKLMGFFCFFYKLMLISRRYKLIFPLLKGSYLVLVRVEVPHHSLDCSVGLSFCAMWYKALIAFMLNKGGFLSAEREEPTLSILIQLLEISRMESDHT